MILFAPTVFASAVLLHVLQFWFSIVFSFFAYWYLSATFLLIWYGFCWKRLAALCVWYDDDVVGSKNGPRYQIKFVFYCFKLHFSDLPFSSILSQFKFRRFYQFFASCYVPLCHVFAIDSIWILSKKTSSVMCVMWWWWLSWNFTVYYIWILLFTTFLRSPVLMHSLSV